MAWSGKDETALWLRLDYATPFDSGWGGWLGPERLAAMGADTSHRAVRDRAMAARPAFAVLELDGPAWRDHVARRVAERERELASDSSRVGRDSLLALFRDGLERGSHLVLMDAGPDAAALAHRYPDAARHLILPAVVRTYRDYRFQGPGAPVDTVLNASMDIEHGRLLVSGRHAAAFRPPPPDGYRVTLATGRSYAPWVRSVE